MTEGVLLKTEYLEQYFRGLYALTSGFLPKLTIPRRQRFTTKLIKQDSRVNLK